IKIETTKPIFPRGRQIPTWPRTAGIVDENINFAKVLLRFSDPTMSVTLNRHVTRNCESCRIFLLYFTRNLIKCVLPASTETHATAFCRESQCNGSSDATARPTDHDYFTL